MVSGRSAACGTSTTPWFLRGLAALMVFVQFAVAAAVCPDSVGGPHRMRHDCSQVADGHPGVSDQICASSFAPTTQVPASERGVQLPDLGPRLVVTALWPAAHPMPQAQPRDDEPPSSPVPRFLSLRRLLR